VNRRRAGCAGACRAWPDAGQRALLANAGFILKQISTGRPASSCGIAVRASSAKFF